MVHSTRMPTSTPPVDLHNDLTLCRLQIFATLAGSRHLVDVPVVVFVWFFKGQKKQRRQQQQQQKNSWIAI